MALLKDFRRPGPRPISVSELSEEIKRIISSQPSLADIAVVGELQNFKLHSSGHAYFTLVDEGARISCVMFRSSASSVVSWPRDGDEVLVTGGVDVYPKAGAYQLYATRMMPIGVGAQARAKEELSRVLAAEGIFDPRNKRPLPRYPSKIAVVTSPTGAAIQDILRVSGDRAPFVDIVLIPALVQGIEAPTSIVRALALCGALIGPECVILARGGGSRDDLSPFDDERVVRAIRNCPIPVVTGIGHQIDRSLSDMASDASEATPSAAAERVFPDSAQLATIIYGTLAAIKDKMDTIIRDSSKDLQALSDTIGRQIERALSSCDAEISQNEKMISSAVTRICDDADRELVGLASRINASSPLAVLSRGYAVCTAADGTALQSAAAVSIGDDISVRLKDGVVDASVTMIKL